MPVLVVAVVVVVTVIATPFLFYTVWAPRFDRRHRQRNDAVLFEDYCANGVIYRFHSMNRHIPSDPRCKLGDRTCDEMVAAAVELVEAAEARSVPLGIGVGLHLGNAWVGNVGEGEMKDFTALGDVVNTASRLQACAASGQIVISDEAFMRVRAPLDARSESFTVKGKDQPLAAHVVALTA